MPRVDFTRAAERDLIEIYLHGLVHFGTAQAERYASALNAKAELAAAHPESGTDFGTIAPGLRRYQAQAHALYYHPTADGILVLRVLHGRMDAGRHLD